MSIRWVNSSFDMHHGLSVAMSKKKIEKKCDSGEKNQTTNRTKCFDHFDGQLRNDKVEKVTLQMDSN